MITEKLHFFDWHSTRWEASLIHPYLAGPVGSTGNGRFQQIGPDGQLYNNTEFIHFISDIGELWKAKYYAEKSYFGLAFGFIISRQDPGHGQNIKSGFIRIRDWEQKKWQVTIQANGWELTPM